MWVDARENGRAENPQNQHGQSSNPKLSGEAGCTVHLALITGLAGGSWGLAEALCQGKYIPPRRCV